MALTSLKMSEADKKEDYATKAPSPDNAPDYPYGSKLCFDTDEVEKLGLDSVKGEQPVLITAKGYVSRVSSTESDGEMCRSVEIQITDIEILDGSKKTPQQIAKALYGGAEPTDVTGKDD